MVELLGEYRAKNGQAECLEDQMLADVFEFEGRVILVGLCSFFFNMTTYIS